jgi:hypothetical protein
VSGCDAPFYPCDPARYWIWYIALDDTSTKRTTTAKSRIVWDSAALIAEGEQWPGRERAFWFELHARKWQ